MEFLQGMNIRGVHGPAAGVGGDRGSAWNRGRLCRSGGPPPLLRFRSFRNLESRISGISETGVPVYPAFYSLPSPLMRARLAKLNEHRVVHTQPAELLIL